MADGLKVQINSLEALERLIGGDSTMEFDIRQSIVEAFTKKHLKSIANDNLMLTIGAAVSKEIRTSFVAESGSSWSTSYTLLPKTKEILDDAIQVKLGQYIQARVDAISEALNITGRITELIENAAKKVENQLTDKALELRIQARVDERIKTALGIK